MGRKRLVWVAGLGGTLVLFGKTPASIVNLVSATFLVIRHRAGTWGEVKRKNGGNYNGKS
jgi:hypothetical protein